MRAPTNFLGKRDVNFPDLGLSPTKDFEFNNDYKNSPLNIEKELKFDGFKEISLNLNSPISDLNYKDGKMLIATEEYGLYITDKNLDKISSHLVLDKYFSATVERFAGVNLIGDNIRIMGINKTSVDVKENENADEVANFRYFLEGADKFEELGRDRLKTSRAKNFYILSARSDDKYTYMLTVPNNKYKDLYVVEQLNSDKGLAAEWAPDLGSNLSLKNGRSINELYISALALNEGKLYAASKAYNTLIVIDPKEKSIIDVYGLPKELSNIRAITFVNDKLLVVDYKDNKNIIYSFSF